MFREKRTVVLVVLTLFIYALNVFLEHNYFVFPFPIFDFVLLIISLQFAIWNIKDLITFRKWHFYIYASSLILKLLTNPIFWGFFLNEIELETFLQTQWMDYFKIGFTLTSILVFFIWSFIEKLKFKIIISVFLSVILLLGSFEASYWFNYLSFPFFATYVVLQKPKNSLSYLLILHGILDLMTLSILGIAH
jgi:hypothetical protein